jgi:hypothetical protein
MISFHWSLSDPIKWYPLYNVSFEFWYFESLSTSELLFCETQQALEGNVLL